MQPTTFKIRRKIILAFLFSLLSVLIFSAFSFQVHREIGHRLRLLELTDDMFHIILELRRVEKNFFLYRQVASLNEAEPYLKRGLPVMPPWMPRWGPSSWAPFTMWPSP
jgi:hypothetical protein